MIDKVPGKEDLISIMGTPTFMAWEKIVNFIEENYVMDSVWDKGGKYGIFVVRFRKNLNIRH